ncbi:tetratricopeptide repeat protein [bacterium]|nr:tetratricopeptide repeat protein [bacterium]MBP9808908.1 tetratricopeptide repeat protein [bacterium]
MTAIPFSPKHKNTLIVYLSCSTLACLATIWASPVQAQTKNSDPLFAQGKDYFAAGDLNRALSSFRQYEALKPNNIAVHFWIGLILDQTGDSKSALSEYNLSLAQAASIGTDSAELRINMGNALAKLGYNKEALMNYQRAIVIDGLNPLAHLGLSKCLVDNGDYDGALRAIDRFVALGGRDVNVYLIRGLALTGQAKFASAREQLHSFLNSNQTNNSTTNSTTNKALTQIAVKILSEIEIMQ